MSSRSYDYRPTSPDYTLQPRASPYNSMDNSPRVAHSPDWALLRSRQGMLSPGVVHNGLPRGDGFDEGVYAGRNRGAFGDDTLTAGESGVGGFSTGGWRADGLGVGGADISGVRGAEGSSIEGLRARGAESGTWGVGDLDTGAGGRGGSRHRGVSESAISGSTVRGSTIAESVVGGSGAEALDAAGQGGRPRMSGLGAVRAVVEHKGDGFGINEERGGVIGDQDLESIDLETNQPVLHLSRNEVFQAIDDFNNYHEYQIDTIRQLQSMRDGIDRANGALCRLRDASINEARISNLQQTIRMNRECRARLGHTIRHLCKYN